MSPLIRHILLYLSAALVAAGLVVAVAVGQWAQRDARVTKVEVVIEDWAQRQYVSVNELTALLRQQEAWPEGKTFRECSLQRMENIVRQHPMVRQAECYPTADGRVVLRLTQRVPLLRVQSGDQCWYVDTDYKVMPPRASVRAEVLTASGRIGEKTSCEELARMAAWIQEDAYWSARIRHIRVDQPRYVVLLQRDGAPAIVLGEMGDYRRKLKKMRIFQQEGGMSLPGGPYRELDVRFDGQVVGRK